MPRLDFRPERDGFHFANRFANRVGPFTTYGRCGGMVYAALDHYLTGTPMPSPAAADVAPTGVPADGTPLADYIQRRSLASMLNVSAARFLTWQAPWRSADDCVARSLGDELTLLQQRIDGGRLTPLGLVARSGGLTASHQALAYGYDVDGDGRPLVHVWDSNRPDVECVLRPNDQRDAVEEFDTATDPGLTRPVAQWKGFFVHHHYDLAAPQQPPDLAVGGRPRESAPFGA